MMGKKLEQATVACEKESQSKVENSNQIFAKSLVDNLIKSFICQCNDIKYKVCAIEMTIFSDTPGQLVGLKVGKTKTKRVSKSLASAKGITTEYASVHAPNITSQVPFQLSSPDNFDK